VTAAASALNGGRQVPFFRSTASAGLQLEPAHAAAGPTHPSDCLVILGAERSGKRCQTDQAISDGACRRRWKWWFHTIGGSGVGHQKKKKPDPGRDDAG